MDYSKTKVCHITTVHPYFDTRIFWRECRSLKKGGYDVILIAPHDRSETVEGIKIVPLPKTKSRLKRRLLTGFKAFLLALQQKTALYHFHDPEFLPWAFLLKCITHRPVIYDVHEDYPHFIVRRNPLLRRTAFFSIPLSRFLLEYLPSLFCDVLVFPTYSLRRRVGKSKGVVLLNLPIWDEFKKNPSIPWGKKQYDIVHLGTLSVSRFQFMLKVAKHLKEGELKFKWLFIGVPPNMLSRIRVSKEEKFVNEHFKFVEWMPIERVIPFLRESRIGFNYHPLEKHTLVALPVKVLEYMSMGLPFVTTSLPELKMLIPKGCGVFLDSQEPFEYALAIQRLLQNPPEAVKMGEMGRKLVEERLNWEVSEEEKLLNCYENLLSGRKANEKIDNKR